jgi:hypothetical protein
VSRGLGHADGAMRLINTIILLLLLSASLALAETVDVKYRGALDLAPFACTDVARSSFIRRVCFDKVVREEF